MADSFWSLTPQEAESVNTPLLGANPFAGATAISDLMANQTQAQQIIQNMQQQQALNPIAVKQAQANLAATQAGTTEANIANITYTPAQANALIKGRLHASTAYTALSPAAQATMDAGVDQAYSPTDTATYKNGDKDPAGNVVGTDEDAPDAGSPVHPVSNTAIKEFEMARLQRPTWVKGTPFSPTMDMSQATDANGDPLYKDVMGSTLDPEKQYDTIVNADDPTQVKFIPAGTSADVMTAKLSAKSDADFNKFMTNCQNLAQRRFSVLGQLVGFENSIAKALNVLSQPVITAQAAEELVLDLGRVLSGAQQGGAAQSTLQSLQFNTLQGDLANKIQYYMGKPQQNLPPAVMDYFKGQFTRLQGVVNTQLQSQLGQLRLSGAQYLSDPAHANVFDAWANSVLNGQVPSTGSPSLSIPTGNAAPNPQGIQSLYQQWGINQ